MMDIVNELNIFVTAQAINSDSMDKTQFSKLHGKRYISAVSNKNIEESVPQKSYAKKSNPLRPIEGSQQKKYLTKGPAEINPKDVIPMKDDFSEFQQM